MTQKISQPKERIPDKILKEIFPQKLKKRGASEDLYTYLKKMILSGKLKKGQKLTYDGIALDFNVSRGIVHNVISRLKKDGLWLGGAVSVGKQKIHRTK
jgi:hypothetical protein